MNLSDEFKNGFKTGVFAKEQWLKKSIVKPPKTLLTGLHYCMLYNAFDGFKVEQELIPIQDNSRIKKSDLKFALTNIMSKTSLKWEIKNITSINASNKGDYWGIVIYTNNGGVVAILATVYDDDTVKNEIKTLACNINTDIATVKFNGGMSLTKSSTGNYYSMMYRYCPYCKLPLASIYSSMSQDGKNLYYRIIEFVDGRYFFNIYGASNNAKQDILKCLDMCNNAYSEYCNVNCDVKYGNTSYLISQKFHNVINLKEFPKEILEISEISTIMKQSATNSMKAKELQMDCFFSTTGVYTSFPTFFTMSNILTGKKYICQHITKKYTYFDIIGEIETQTQTEV